MVNWFEPSPAAKAAVKMGRFRVSPTQYINEAKPYCDEPVFICLTQRPGALPGVYVQQYGPCRRCGKCLLFRRLKWAERMAHECAVAPRSWFVTLTFDPIHLAGVVMESHARKEREESARIEAAAYGHCQGYFKRLRKARAKFRYVAVAEYGEERGRLHYHLLIHEIEQHSVTYRLLDRKWRSFINASLVQNPQGTGSYVSKYLTKSSSRIRASEEYGYRSPPPKRTIEGTIIEEWERLTRKQSPGVTYPPRLFLAEEVRKTKAE